MSKYALRLLDYAPAVILVIFYFVYDREILNLFAATWYVIHAKGDEILDAIKEREAV